MKEFTDEFKGLQDAQDKAHYQKLNMLILRLKQSKSVPDEKKLVALFKMRYTLAVWSYNLKYPAAAKNNNIKLLFETYTELMAINSKHTAFGPYNWAWCNLLIHQLNTGAFKIANSVAEEIKKHPKYGDTYDKAALQLKNASNLSTNAIQMLELNALTIFAQAKYEIFNYHALAPSLLEQYACVLSQLRKLVKQNSYRGFFSDQFIDNEEAELSRYKCESIAELN